MELTLKQVTISILIALAVLIPLAGIVSASSSVPLDGKGAHILHAPPLPPVPALPTPPPNFNPLTASDAELARYGFPHRPANLKALANWKLAMAHAKHYVAPAIDTSFGKVTIGLASNVVTEYSKQFAGYFATNTQNGAKVTETFGWWIQPTVFSVEPNGLLATWSGIEGPTGSPEGSLVQAGTVAFTTNPVVYRYFYEDFPNAAVILTNTIQPRPSDQIYVDVVYFTSTQRASYFWMDDTTGEYTSIVDNAPYYDGTWSDYVLESRGSPLPASLNIPFGDCNLVWYKPNFTTGEGTLGSFDSERTIMTDTGTVAGTLEVTTTILGPDLQSFSLLRGPQ